jgi:DNA-directed RNA polymerase subunit F
MEIKSEEFVYPAEALRVLEETDEEERTHEQAIALENLTRHVQVEDEGTLEELHEELSEIESLKEKHIYKLLELMPEYESSVRAIFSKERVRLDDSEVEEILDICTSVETEE